MNFKEELIKLGVEFNNDIALKFDTYYHYLIEVNEYMNLTAITDEAEVYNKHFLDSLYITKALNCKEKYTLCDVGSGAGFPSVPLAIIDNNVSVTIIDALNKRINFLNDLTNKLNLQNVKAYHKRAEEFSTEKREFFDVVTARAVARLNVLAELCLPLVKENGVFIAMKAEVSDELNEAKRAIEILGGRIEKIISCELPDNAGARDIIIIRKIKATPVKYPRAFAKIKEKPL